MTTNRMAGYLAAHCMKVIRDTFTAPAAEDRWRGVLATQTVNAYCHQYAMIAGAKQYIEEHDRSLKMTDLFNDLAVTGYLWREFGKDQDNRR
jgi:hypothetical protein